MLPSSVCLLSLVTETAELAALLEPLRLGEKELVLIPITDGTISTRGGGSHWSLLVFWRERRSFLSVAPMYA